MTKGTISKGCFRGGGDKLSNEGNREQKTGSEAKVRIFSPDFQDFRENQAADTPTRTGDGPRRQPEKLSDEENRANKNRFINQDAENFSGKKGKRRRL